MNLKRFILLGLLYSTPVYAESVYDEPSSSYSVFNNAAPVDSIYSNSGPNDSVYNESTNKFQNESNEPQVAQLLTTGVTNTTTAAPGYQGPGDVIAFNAWYGTYAYNAASRGTNAVQVCESTNTTCVNVVSDATTGIVPNPSPGGTACNTSTNICTVRTWYDQVAGTFNQVQVTASLRSVWVPAGNCTGLGSSISCASQTAAQYQSAANVVSAQPFSFAWVVNRNTSTATNTDLFSSASGAVEIGAGFFGANDDAICYAGSSGLDIAATDGSWYALSCNVNGGSSNIKKDAGAPTSGNAGAATLSGKLDFMYNSSAGRNWQGKFAGGGVALSNFTTGNLTSLNANAHTNLGF